MLLIDVEPPGDFANALDRNRGGACRFEVETRFCVDQAQLPAQIYTTGRPPLPRKGCPPLGQTRGDELQGVCEFGLGHAALGRVGHHLFEEAKQSRERGISRQLGEKGLGPGQAIAELVEFVELQIEQPMAVEEGSAPRCEDIFEMRSVGGESAGEGTCGPMCGGR